MRDSRINLIFEGSSEIMRLFIAREALDPHLKIGAAMLNSQLSLLQRAKSAVKATIFYARWYPLLWVPAAKKSAKPVEEKAVATGGAAPEAPAGKAAPSHTALHPALEVHMKFARKTSKKLARTLFHAMAWNGPKLESRQVLLGRFVDIGTELFAITATCSRAQLILATEPAKKEEIIKLADYFCHEARLRIDGLFHAIRHNTDRKGYKLARAALDGTYSWLTNGIVRTKFIPRF
jgi:hypothetical protein